MSVLLNVHKKDRKRGRMKLKKKKKTQVTPPISCLSRPGSPKDINCLDFNKIRARTVLHRIVE